MVGFLTTLSNSESFNITDKASPDQMMICGM